MTVSERRKGLRGQQEVQRLFQSLGIDLDKLAAQGDRVWCVRGGEAIRLEVKRQERARLWEWITQARRETPADMTPCVAFRKRGAEWYAVLPLADLVRIAS